MISQEHEGGSHDNDQEDADSCGNNVEEKSEVESYTARYPYVFAWDKDKYFQQAFDQEQKIFNMHEQILIGYRYFAFSAPLE